MDVSDIFKAWHAALSAHRKRMEERGIHGQISAAMLIPPEPEPDELLRLTDEFAFACEGVAIPEKPLTDLRHDPFNKANVNAAEQFAVEFRRKIAARLLYSHSLVSQPVAAKGRKAKPECPVSIDEEGRAVIDGDPTDGPLTPTQRKVIELMIGVFPAGVLKDKFTANGVEEGTARKILRTFRKKHPHCVR